MPGGPVQQQKKSARDDLSQATRSAVDDLFSALRAAPPKGTTAKDVERLGRLYGRGLAEELERLVLRVALTSEQQAPGPRGFWLLLRADPNLDFRPETHQATLAVPGRWVPVESTAEAQRTVRDFIKAWEVGGGNWTGGDLAANGMIFARISYNGQVWDKATDKKLDALQADAQAVLLGRLQPVPTNPKTEERQPNPTARSTVFDDEDEGGEDPEGRSAGEILEDFLSQLKSAMTAAHPEIRERFLAGTEYDGERLKRAFPSTAPIVSELLIAAEEVQDFPDGQGDTAAWEAVQPLIQGLRRLRQSATPSSTSIAAPASVQANTSKNASQPRRGKSTLSPDEEARLWDTMKNSLAYRSQLVSDPELRREMARVKMDNIERELLRQTTMLSSHEPGQAGYSDARVNPKKRAIRAWFREHFQALVEIGEQSMKPGTPQEEHRPIKIRLLHNLPPAILGQVMLPKDSVWEVMGESRVGGFFYGWEVRPPGGSIYVVPKESAERIDEIRAKGKAIPDE